MGEGMPSNAVKEWTRVHVQAMVLLVMDQKLNITTKILCVKTIQTSHANGMAKYAT